MQIPLLTLSIAAQQFAWGIEQAYVTHYLLELGMSRANLSLLWIAGPTCGLVVQPVVGTISDFWASTNGRRRPFMMSSSLVVAIGLLIFAWARSLGDFLGVSPVIFATSGVLLVDIAINVCGATSRALIVDVLPKHRQELANAWAGRMSTGGHLASYLLCTTNVAWIAGDQLKSVCLIGSVLLVLGVGLTCGAVSERILIRPPDESAWHRIKEMLVVSLRTAANLDSRLASIFKVQLFGWYAWFTLLFYGAEWAAELWQRNHDGGNDGAARAGSQALLAFSCSATFWSIVLPMLPFSTINLWSFSYVVYAAAALLTGVVHQYSWAVALFAVVGFSWAMTSWAPFSLTAQRIHELPPEIYENDEEVPTVLNTIVVNPSISSDSDIDDHNCGDKSGIYLGIHNTAITLPQFLSTFGSYLVFRILQTDPSKPGNDGGHAIAITMQIGALFALIAAYFAKHVTTS